jgi:tRNA (mo5U34)-methyltransferase
MAATLQEEVHALQWVHSIDLGRGVVTPGAPRSPIISRAFDAIDFRGKKVLDVGCWDGLWSFEAERRGASEVYATDCLTQRIFAEQPTFQLAHRALQSRAHYVPDLSVYQVEQLGVLAFDIVLFCGVYYHLKHPLLALGRLRRVLKDGGLLVIEGEVLNRRDACHAEFFYRQTHRGDPSNWWVPTIPCLQQWVESSYFEIESEWNSTELCRPRTSVRRLTYALWKWLHRAQHRFARHLFIARAVRRRDPVYMYPDAELARFDGE